METTEVVRVPLSTPFGVFDVHAFERPSGHVYLALVVGDVSNGDDVLVRLHSECLTGDALGSLRCDCGVQLRLAMRTIAAERRGVLVYATGHEGRGIGLVNKLRAYVAQDQGSDTVLANEQLGLPVDSRDYGDAAAVLAELGVRSIRLLTNNPDKVRGLTASGAVVRDVVALTTAPHHRNLGYLTTKERRLGHVRPTGTPLVGADELAPATDVTALLGDVEPRDDRPYVVLKYAQTLDGRIATSTGDSKWISGEDERRISHALRAACDGVLVGVGTVLQDDPELTVRMVPGASPMRVVVDSKLQLPEAAKVLSHDAPTTVFTSELSAPERRDELRAAGVRVEVIDRTADGIDLAEALAVLRASGTESLLVEGGAKVITSLLGTGLVDRIIVAVAPVLIGEGIEAVGPLGVTEVTAGIRLENRAIFPVGDDVLLAWDVVNVPSTS